MSAAPRRVVVNPISFYEHIGPENYDYVVAANEWSGPADMARILTGTPMKGAVVADLGIGTGALSPLFRKASVARIIGVDGAQSYLNYCKRKGLADEVEQADLAVGATRLPDASVDLVTCSGLFSYIGNPESLIWEMHRIAKPGATVALNFHSAYGYIDSETISASSLQPCGVVHFSRFSRGMITDLFEDLGMKLESEFTNPKGLMRSDATYIPLTTQRYTA